MQGNVNYERFPPEYFSGSNIHIFFEDVYIDEIVSLSFAMQEQTKPIYGFNSYTYDAVLRGARMVSGKFQINFKDVNYISSAINEIMESPEDFKFQDNNFDKSNLPDKEKRNKLYDYAKEGWSSEFDRLSQDFEDAIWGEAKKQNTQLKRTNLTKFPDKDVTFDIIITYGPYQQPNSQYDVENKFRKNINTGTIKALKNIQLTGIRQIIDLSGKPIREEYTFFAQDIDRGSSR
jgi:hypothetical protein